MKVYIGPYKNWIGPYQIAGILKHVGVSEDRCDKIGEYLSHTWVNSVCDKIHEKYGKRKVKVKIHAYDTWSIDHTLSFIILPMLKQLKATKHGSPFTDDDDVPDDLKSTSAPPLENEWDLDANHFKRWNWILDEMIWSFEQELDEDADAEYFTKSDEHGMQYDKEGHVAWQKRKDNGFRLFGKYYQNLWD